MLYHVRERLTRQMVSQAFLRMDEVNVALGGSELLEIEVHNGPLHSAWGYSPPMPKGLRREMPRDPAFARWTGIQVEQLIRQFLAGI